MSILINNIVLHMDVYQKLRNLQKYCKLFSISKLEMEKKDYAMS